MKNLLFALLFLISCGDDITQTELVSDYKHYVYRDYEITFQKNVMSFLNCMNCDETELLAYYKDGGLYATQFDAGSFLYAIIDFDTNIDLHSVRLYSSAETWQLASFDIYVLRGGEYELIDERDCKNAVMDGDFIDIPAYESGVDGVKIEFIGTDLCDDALVLNKIIFFEY